MAISLDISHITTRATVMELAPGSSSLAQVPLAGILKAQLGIIRIMMTMKKHMHCSALVIF
jgi:hypothetical protein